MSSRNHRSVHRSHNSTANTSLMQVNATLNSNQQQRQTKREAQAAYDDYLIAALMRSNTAAAIEKKRDVYNEQLVLAMDRESHVRMEAARLKAAVGTHALTALAQENLSAIREHLANTQALIGDDFHRTVNAFSELLDTASNRLYLKNIAPFATQEEYNQFGEVSKKFLSALQEMNYDREQMEQIAQVCKHVDALQTSNAEANRAVEEIAKKYDMIENVVIKMASDGLVQ